MHRKMVIFSFYALRWILFVLISMLLAAFQTAAPVIAGFTHSLKSVNPGPTTTTSIPLQEPGDEHWSDEFAATGIDLVVYALVTDNQGNVYVGGAFTTIENLVVNHIAKWDGSAWSALGNGLKDSVGKLAVDSHGYLYTDTLSYTAE